MRIHTLTALALLVGLGIGCQNEERVATRGFALPTGDARAGEQAVSDLRCYTCHEISGMEDDFPRPTATPMVNVTLGGLAMREPTDGELVTSIVNPSHRIYPGGDRTEERLTSGEGSRMADLNEVMTVQQLIDLVAFLHERYETKEEMDASGT